MFGMGKKVSKKVTEKPSLTILYHPKNRQEEG